MLNPTSAAQKNLSEEDSSGSEAGSEVSLEPETDRFGFILTNGSTAGSVGPSPELVRQREAKWINIIGQWDRILLKKSSKVKVQCQKGIPASLRAKCWPLLCGATDRMKQNNELYKSLDSQPGLQSWADVIERDLDRQFPFHEMFLSKDGHGQRGLFRVLKAYTQYQPEEGYCQAQGPVAAVLLMNMPAEEAFWCLVQISEQYLPGYYSPLLEGVLFDAAVLTWVLKKTCPAAHKHLQHHGVEPLMFATDWLMCLFTRHLPFNTLLRVWDLFFCYGVRVLLQVAVVLVRRVLGRPEQRKLCQGQMETLERLRGVREEVQEEDDSFIGEVCSVPLSAKDLEKQTEKELEKWRKDKPSSTFDPRGRCQGYRMAWARARLSKEEQDRKEREKGNLSVPLARSASTLSLSPSLLHKRWRKGGKVNTGEQESRNRVVRHLSMGAKDDWRNWSDLDFKKVQGVQEEDVDSEGHKTQSESKLTEQSEQQKLLQEPEKMDKEETVKEQTEKVETRATEKEEIQCKETQESKILSEQIEEPNLCPAEHQTVENIPQPAERTSQCEQEEKLDAARESQVLEEQSHNSEDQEAEDTNEETEEHVGEREHAAAAVDNHVKIPREAEADANTEVEQLSADSSVEQIPQSDIKPEESTDTDSVQQVQVDIVVTDVSETRSETSVDSDGDLVTQQTKEEVVTEVDAAVEEKHHSTESLVETEKTEEFNTETTTGADVLEDTREETEANEAKQDEIKGEITQTDSEEHTDTEKESKTGADVLEENQEETEDNEAKQDEIEAEITDSEKESHTKEEPLTQVSLECIQQKQGIGLVADTETEAEISFAKDRVEESSEKIRVLVPTQDKEEIILTVQSEAQVEGDACVCGQTDAETENQLNEEAADPVTQAEAPNETTEPDVQSSVQTETSGTQTGEQPPSQVTMGPVKEEDSTENVDEDDVSISIKPTDDPCKDSHQSAPSSSSMGQTSGPRSSRSSGDFCVRKSSSSRGSRLARKLSQDLFITPQITSQSQAAPDHPEVKHLQSESNPGAAHPTQTAPDVTLSAEVKEDAVVQHKPTPQRDPPKRFGLFRRLRREQPKNAKAQGTPKMQVPKILIQDFSDGAGKPVEEEAEDKLSSRERRRRRRERERREKEEEKLEKKREKELEKERERERRKPQTRGKSFQVQKEKGSADVAHAAKTGSQQLKNSTFYAESYF